MEPLLILFVLPVLIGIVSAHLFRDTRRASTAAALGCATLVYVCLAALDPGGTWNGLAAFLVLPLPMALALAAVVVCYGRSRRGRRHRAHGARGN